MVPVVRKILYATDLGRHARPGFAFAVSLVRSCGARIELVHVLEPVGPYARGVLGL
ncbi:MAG: universal stress protein [Deltaproteobacteria bacterium]|nr:universal stress protein [Deltaproteobacteria bacterium]